ncbi:MAG: hypothetical protein IV100_19460 [Myxococcales bacterium]|nr:hypothetical protein [Myxococcales bacterium]
MATRRLGASGFFLLLACSENDVVVGAVADSGSDATGAADVVQDIAVTSPDTGGAHDVTALPDTLGFDDVEPLPDVADPIDTVIDVGLVDTSTVDTSTVDTSTVDASTGDTSTGDTSTGDTSDGDVLEADTGPKTIAETCFPGLGPSEAAAPVYDQFNPVIGSHCSGTNHQTITGVQKVVFLGDSVTVGTPNDEHLVPTENDHYYRNRLAEYLATKFNLNKGDLFGWGAWKSWDYVGFKGSSLQMESGDFKNCSKFGARTDDFLEGGSQIAQCFPEGGSDKTTLVVFTMGGNDVSSITQKGGEATPEEVAAGYPALMAQAQQTADYLDDAIAWLKEPGRFPNGVYVVYANPFEFTDGSGITSACKPASIEIPFVGSFDLSAIDINMAEVAGFKEWADKAAQAAIVVHLLEEFMRIAVKHQVDMVMMLEQFCGHGFVATGPDADTTNRCYKGPDAELWFDITCFHPSEAGHQAIFEMFKATIEE